MLLILIKCHELSTYPHLAQILRGKKHFPDHTVSNWKISFTVFFFPHSICIAFLGDRIVSTVTMKRCWGSLVGEKASKSFAGKNMPPKRWKKIKTVLLFNKQYIRMCAYPRQFTSSMVKIERHLILLNS